MAFSFTHFKKARQNKHRWGIILFWGGLVALLLDVSTPFPTPVRGAFASIWLLVIVAGIVLLALARRLPLEEALEIAKKTEYHGELRVSDLISELNVSLNTAERILHTLEKRGYARVVLREMSQVWIIPDAQNTTGG